MKESRVAIRYAKALFDLAQSENLLEELHRDMKMLSDLFLENREFQRFLISPIIANKKKKAIIKEIIGSKVDALTMNFVGLMVDNSREHVLGAVAFEFYAMYKELNGIVSAELITTELLDPKLRKELVEVIEQEMKARVELTEKADSSILGGFKLKIEDKMFDASIIHKIQKLSREFDKNIYEKGF